MTSISRRAGLRASAALAATTLASPWRAFAQAGASSPTAAASAPPSRQPVFQGPDGALLAERLRYEGVLLATMAVKEGGPPQFSGASIDGPAPDSETLFELGSITKTFTALLLADAVTRGLIKLDDPVEAALPDKLKLRDSQDQPLRWIDLATHRSGLPRLPDNLRTVEDADPYATYDWAAMRSYLQTRKADRPRQAGFSYSNLGFGLMGQALGFLQDTDYPTLLKRRVLQPLGLEDQITLPPAPKGRRFPDAHDKDGHPVAHWTFRPAMAGAGALLGSPRGVARYAQAALGQFDHPLKAAFALCLQRHAARDNDSQGIGLAWLMAPMRDGRTVLNHDGGTAGFSTSLWLDPSRKAASAALANASVVVLDLGLHLIEPSIPVTDLSLTRQTAITMTPEQLKPLEGNYRLSPALTVTIRAEGNRLFARATGQGENELFAKAPRVFFMRVTPLEVEFEEGDAGAPAPALTVNQRGRRTRAPRVE